MKKLIALGALVGALTLGGCAWLQQQAGDSPAAADALKAAQVAITTYADVYQPAVLAYGQLPACPHPTPSGSVCRDPAVHAKLKAVDLAASRSIEAARAVLEGSLTDSGQITAMIQSIGSAETAIAAAGAVLKQ